VCESFQKLKDTIGVIDIRDFDHQLEVKSPQEETKYIPTSTTIKTDSIYPGELNPRVDASMSGMLSRNRAPSTDKYGQRKPGLVPINSQYPMYNGQSPSMAQGYPGMEQPLDTMNASRPYPPSVLPTIKA
jgi:hypothetical protein